MRLESLHDLFVHELRDLHNAERQLVAALPRFADAATRPDLQDLLRQHLEETEGHVEALGRIFETLDEDPAGRKCHGMEGLIEEVDRVLETDAEAELKDLDLIAAARPEPRVQPSPLPGLRGSPSSAPSREGASRLRGSGGRSRG